MYFVTTFNAQINDYVNVKFSLDNYVNIYIVFKTSVGYFLDLKICSYLKDICQYVYDKLNKTGLKVKFFERIMQLILIADNNKNLVQILLI